ncbi:MAG: diguanylate cyclase [Gammaproteobacteria bacterium]|nr:diguanylate cyclase [Gammaproteobacteria bacterium]
MNSEQENSNEEDLKRFLMRISYSGMGVDRKLDELLSQLRKSIKQQAAIDDLKFDVDAITEHLRELEERIEAKSKAGKNNNESDESLISFISQIEQTDIDNKLKKQLNKLRKQATKSNAKAIIEELVKVIESALQHSEIKSKRWNPFSRSKKESGDNIQAEESDAVPATDGSNLIPASLVDALHNFAEQLANIDIYKKASSEIKKQIQELEYFDQLSSLIEQIASVLLEAANQEHVQFENFLQKLNKRLLNVASYLNKAAVGQEGILADSEKLDNDLKSTILDIQQEIQDSSGLGPLKQRLLGSFEHIFNSVNRFKESQATRVEASLAELKIVREQLEVTEEEADRLKENLKQQRFKAYNDPLTLLPNRYAYNERLSQDYSRWRRYRTPLSLTVCDIDYFKQVNDKYGHSAGDEVLKQVANILNNGIRESDFIARYGGEEFVILMPETGLADATKAINKLRIIIRDTAVSIAKDKNIKVTVSAGVAEFESNDTANDVFAKADKALYRAKEKGRDQVCAERTQKLKPEQ